MKDIVEYHFIVASPDSLDAWQVVKQKIKTNSYQRIAESKPMEGIFTTDEKDKILELAEKYVDRLRAERQRFSHNSD